MGREFAQGTLGVGGGGHCIPLKRTYAGSEKLRIRKKKTKLQQNNSTHSFQRPCKKYKKYIAPPPTHKNIWRLHPYGLAVGCMRCGCKSCTIQSN